MYMCKCDIQLAEKPAQIRGLMRSLARCLQILLPLPIMYLPKAGSVCSAGRDYMYVYYPGVTGVNCAFACAHACKLVCIALLMGYGCILRSRKPILFHPSPHASGKVPIKLQCHPSIQLLQPLCRSFPAQKMSLSATKNSL